MKRFHIETLGCKINQYESQALREAWQALGLRETSAEEADVIVVNSCAVTASAVRDLRKLANALHRQNPERPIVVTGCAAQVLAEEVKELPGVALVVPQAEKQSLKAGPLAVVSALPARVEVGRAYPDLSIKDFERARAIVKIQDGCSHGCTYCIVPLSRGKSVSRSPADVLAEAQRLLEAGFRELVIGGINLRHYHATGGWDFWSLLAWLDERLASEWEGRARLRISSLDPGQLTERGLETLAGTRLVAPHLHISLQSGSPAVLRAMGRGHYAPERVAGFVESLASVWPIFGLGFDLLVGFPGETEENAGETLNFCASLPLSYAHVFPYSRRPGTKAASLPDQLRREEKKARAARLRGLVAGRRALFLERALALPETAIVLEDAATGRGVNELYLDCELTRVPEGARPRSLVKGRPTGLAGATPGAKAGGKADGQPGAMLVEPIG